MSGFPAGGQGLLQRVVPAARKTAGRAATLPLVACWRQSSGAPHLWALLGAPSLLHSSAASCTHAECVFKSGSTRNADSQL